MGKLAKLIASAPNPDECLGNGATCFETGKARQVNCSLCNLCPPPGTMLAPKFPEGAKEPVGGDYFCGACFPISRPASYCCQCPESRELFKRHREFRDGVQTAQRPNEPTQHPRPPASSSEQSWGSVPVMSPPFRDYAHLMETVAQMQKDVDDMKIEIEVLEHSVHLLETADKPEQRRKTPEEADEMSTPRHQ